MTRFARLAETSDAVAAAAARNAKVALLSDVVRDLAPDEVAAAVAFLAGDLLQRQIGVGWASLKTVPAPAAEPTLEIDEVAATFERIGALGGAGSVDGAPR